MIFRPLLLLAGLTLAVAGSAAFLPALRIAPVEVTDARACADLLDRANAAMKARHGVPLFLRVYLETSLTGEARSAGFVLYPSGSVAGLEANQQALAGDGELVALRTKLAALTGAAPVTYLKAVRFDGTNQPGWLLNTWVRAGDEVRLLAGVTALAGQLAGTPPKINVFRVIAGDAEVTHLISCNAASAAELTVLMDRLEVNLALLATEGGADVIRAVVYREISGEP